MRYDPLTGSVCPCTHIVQLKKAARRPQVLPEGGIESNRHRKNTERGNTKDANMFGMPMPMTEPVYDDRDIDELADEFRRSKESLKAVGRRLTSRQASRATRTSRASIESRGPLSSNEDLDLHVDLPPGILADESAASSPPSRPPGHPSGKATRKTKRSSTTRSERKAERSVGVQPMKQRRGFRAKLRRIFGRDSKPEAITDAKPQTPAPLKRDHQDDGLQPDSESKAAPRRSPNYAEAESSSSKDPAPPPSTGLPKNDTATL
ncbi:hypothetical protein LX36DRAFT_44219 [Colletotrichum falcatum]|nr:hypothetical protein LX36DRAFT_44219 [Colletotrichum falcatum]